MRIRISEIKGVDDALAAKLKELGLTNSDDLLRAAATPQQRAELASKIGLQARDILEFVNRSDLARIKGIGRVYSDLLEFAGVDTVVELSRRVPKNLHAKIAEVGTQHGVKRLPRLDEIQSWIAQASGLDRIIEY